MANSDLLDKFSWPMSISRVRLTSVASFDPQSTIDIETVTNLQGFLNVLRQLKIPHVSCHELRALESIGGGMTFSVVKHLWRDRYVALKYIKQPDTDEAQFRDTFRKRLKSMLQEILVMNHKSLAIHPNIIELLGHGWQQTEGPPAPYTIVELGSLGNLRQLLQLQKPWDLQKKLIVAGDVAAGLMALHQAGVVHGDLKLDNVVCVPTCSRPTACQAKLCDFSHSIFVSGKLKNVRYYGTPRYLPPEALTQQTRPISSADIHKCDIWALGLALWEILLDGDVYFQLDWLHDSQHSRPDSMYRSIDSSRTLLAPESSSANISQSRTVNEWSQCSLVFGDFDLSRLSTLACEVVDRLTRGNVSSLGFARSYLRPLMKRTLHPDPKSRSSDIARWPIIADWQKTSRHNALQSKPAFHTHASTLNFDIFRLEPTDLAWSVQVQIHNDLQFILASYQEGSYLSRTSLQIAFCKALGFGCEMDFSKAAVYLRAGLQHSPALADSLGESLRTGFEGRTTSEDRLFANRMATLFASRWDIDLHSAVSLHKRPIDVSCSDREQHASRLFKLSTFNSLQDFLLQAVKCFGSSSEAVLSQYVIRYDGERESLSWLELAVLWSDRGFIDTYRDILFDDQLDKINSWTLLTPLLLACVRGQAEVVRRLLHRGADPRLTTSDGCNLLHFLFCLEDEAVDVLQKAVKICPKLIDKINLPCKKAFKLHTQWPTEIEGSPLAIAVTAGHLSLAQALLEYGAFSWTRAFASKQSDQDYVWTPMHLAVKYNFCDLVTLFINQVQPSVANWKDKGNFPLASALSFLTSVERYGIHGSSSKAALEKTVDLIQRNALCFSSVKGATAIFQAIDYENHDVVRALLEYHPALAVQSGADPEDPSNFTFPFHLACQTCSRKDIQYALQISREILKAHEGALTMVDGHGRSALHCAVMSGYPLVAEWLLDKGLDVNGRDRMERSPLMLCQSIKTAMVLIERGANLDLQDESGRSAAHYAASRGDPEILALLLKCGVQANSICNSSYTLLHEAVGAVSLECVKLLCQAGASLNAVGADGRTPLHIAIATTPEIVQELVDRGSNLSILDDLGRTAVRAVLARLTVPSDDSNEAQRMFETLIRPLLCDLDAQKHNDGLLAWILNICATYGNDKSIQVLFRGLGRESPITANTSWQGIHPLHAAASTVNTDSALALTKVSDVELNAFDCHGRTVLMYLSTLSSTDGNIERFGGLMCEAGADLGATNAELETAWSIAVRLKNFVMLECFLSRASAEMVKDMLETHPLTKEFLLSAIDANFIALVTTFSRRVRNMPSTYETDMLDSLARVCWCFCTWAAVGVRLTHVCLIKPLAIRLLFRGQRAGRALKEEFDRIDAHGSPVWSEQEEQAYRPMKAQK